MSEQWDTRPALAETIFTGDYSGPRWRYGMTHRPPGYAHNPANRIVGADQPAPCPCSPYGTIEYARELSADEVYSYELLPMDGHRCPEQCPRCLGGVNFEERCFGDGIKRCPIGGYACEGWGQWCCQCGRKATMAEVRRGPERATPPPIQPSLF